MERLDGLACQTGQSIGEIEARVGSKPAAGFDDREDSGDLRACILMSEMDPVFSSQGDCAHGVFSDVGRQLQLRILEESGELVPQGERVVGRFGGGACRQGVLECGLQRLA